MWVKTIALGGCSGAAHKTGATKSIRRFEVIQITSAMYPGEIASINSFHIVRSIRASTKISHPICSSLHKLGRHPSSCVLYTFQTILKAVALSTRGSGIEMSMSSEMLLDGFALSVLVLTFYYTSARTDVTGLILGGLCAKFTMYKIVVGLGSPWFFIGETGFTQPCGRGIVVGFVHNI